jgi:predicted dehydrogenase
MNTVRFGIIGMGNIGVVHAENFLSGRANRGELTAIVSSSPAKQEAWREKGFKVFAHPTELFHAREVDAVIIATPHPQHLATGVAAFKAGLHVLMEKPIAAHKSDAEKLIANYKLRMANGESKRGANSKIENRNLKFACMFQKRAEPCFQKMRALVHGGELGEIVRVNWINTDWYRTGAYYASGGWRATWAGEGGGVLLNQCLHNLDALQWICGMPARVRGFCQFGRFHKIEVEDSVTAYLEWANHSTGVFIGSTGEAPGTNRFEIAGTRGKLVLENDRLVFTRNETDALEFSRITTDGFAKPKSNAEEIPLEKIEHPHAVITQNFVNAILENEPLLAPGDEGIHALELANAITFSSLKNKTVELPMNGATWKRELKKLGAHV